MPFASGNVAVDMPVSAFVSVRKRTRWRQRLSATPGALRRQTASSVPAVASDAWLL